MPVLFGYPCGSVAALLGGVLSLRYCSGRFTCWVPSWTLPAHGHVQGLITDNDGATVVLRDEQVDRALLPWPGWLFWGALWKEDSWER